MRVGREAAMKRRISELRKRTAQAVGKDARVPRNRSRCRSGRGRRRTLGATVLAAFLATTVRADQPPPAALPDLSLEQLVEVPLVSVVSKRPQKADEAPSLITVVTGDEIRRNGYRTLADVLRALPGFYVSYDRNYSYVGVRGFGRPGDYNTRILLLVDGVRVNDNVYDGAYVGREGVVDLQVVERIEVSRGPGAAVYGNNAFFGVVNVVTKRGGQMAGGSVSAGGSSHRTGEGHVRYGRKLSGGGELMGAASLLASDGQTLQFPEFAEQGGGVVAHADGERSRRLFGSFVKDGLAVEALHSSRTKHIPTASYGTVFGDTRASTRDAFTAVAASYDRTFAERFDWSSRLSYMACDYDGVYPFALDGGVVSLYQDESRGRWWNGESLGVLRAGAHTVLLGGEVTHSLRQDQGSGYVDVPGSQLQIPHHGVRYGAFVQDDLALGKSVRVSLGGRYDHSQDFVGQVHPRLGVIVTPDDRTTVKVLYGTAYRAPNQYEQSYYDAQRLAPALRPERIRSAEAAVERRLGRVRVSGSLFSNEIRDLITLESDPAGELFFRNTSQARSRGMEAGGEVHLASGAAAALSYSYQRTRDGEGRPLSNSPAHMVKGTLSVPLWARGRGSVDAQYVGARGTLGGRRTSGFLLVNTTLLGTRLVRGLEASLSVYNLLGAAYADPGSEEHRQDAIRQDGRTVAVTLGWRF
jgi:iron complex outermembrane receptor protein